jgi:tRNA threonylcarbamoyladenosine biosynthesis protein TsaE
MSILDRLSGDGILTESLEESQSIAVEFAQCLPEDSSVALHGNLGVGKTTFAAGLARAFGITEPVKSPSYNIMSIYEGYRQVIHIDAYRLSSVEALDALMLEDLLTSPWILIVEWAENVDNELPLPIYHLNLSIEEGKHRICLLELTSH